MRHLVDRLVKGNLVSLRGFREATEFPHELQRRSADFRFRRRRFEVVQSLNVSTHSICSGPPSVFKDNITRLFSVSQRKLFGNPPPARSTSALDPSHPEC